MEKFDQQSLVRNVQNFLVQNFDNVSDAGLFWNSVVLYDLVSVLYLYILYRHNKLECLFLHVFSKLEIGVGHRWVISRVGSSLSCS